jgi:hypothetical protein
MTQLTEQELVVTVLALFEYHRRPELTTPERWATELAMDNFRSQLNAVQADMQLLFQNARPVFTEAVSCS